MQISLVTIAFNGYGKYLCQFLAFVSNMSPKPNEVIVVLGKDHKCRDVELAKAIYPKAKILIYKKRASFGKLRNIGINKTNSEWVWFVSIDDKPMPDAIRTFKRALKDQDGDFICSQWYTIGLGRPLQPHKSPTPAEMADHINNGRGGGFIIAHSPYKKWLWEAHPYRNSNLPNYDFTLHCVLSGARFVKSDKPTTTYLRRSDSHARTTLKKIKSKARNEKQKMQQGIVNYYATH